MPKGWTEIGYGSFNLVYRSNDGQLILKIQHTEDKTDSPERSVRLWNDINSHLPPPARIHKTEDGIGWVCPYIDGEEASPEEISDALIDIYNRTGRIVVDATATKNFLKTKEGKIICVDIGMALELDNQENVVYSNTMKRRNSIVSLYAWGKLEEKFPAFFEQCIFLNPKNSQTIQIVKALIFIKRQRPDILDVSFLKTSPELATKLADAYDNPQAHEKIISCTVILEEQRPITLTNIKESCRVELLRYIGSRGSINKITQEFKPSLTTNIFRNSTLTAKKVKAIKELIARIENAESLETIEQALQEKADTELLSSKITKGVEKTLGKCMAMIIIAKKHDDCQLHKNFSIRLDGAN